MDADPHPQAAVPLAELLPSVVADVAGEVGDRAPAEYFAQLLEACRARREHRYGGIKNEPELRANIAAHAIPEGGESMTAEGYDGFLLARRRLMAAKMKGYYEGL